MKKYIIFTHLFLLNYLLHYEIVRSTQIEWLHNTTYNKNKLDIENLETKFNIERFITLSANEQVAVPVMNLEPDHTYETDVEIHNSITTFNNTRYEKYLKFWAFGSHFNIYLQKQLLFHHSMTITHTTGSDAYIYIPIFYVGFNYDVLLSVVYGMFDGTKFEGKLNWNNITVFIECPKTFNDRGKQFKYVIQCKIIQKTNIKTNKNDTTDDCNSQEDKCPKCNAKSSPHRWGHIKNLFTQYNRTRRSISSQGHICSLHIVADHLYFKHVGSSNIGSTIKQMTSLIAVADTAFRSTDFSGDGYGDNIGFVIKNITVYDDPFLPGYKLKGELDVQTYLSTFSEYNFKNYCLGVAFTYRDFDDDVVGLAWVGSSDYSGPPGGICENRLIGEDGKMISYNTLIISQRSGGRYYPDHKAALVLTHEIGHSFGASHDNENNKECAPNDEFGNYLMYPYVITGIKPNNNKFSNCSIHSIFPVIMKKGQCLTNYLGPTCGNSIIEEFEECDCGTVSTCPYVDPCCTPADTDGSDKPCHIRISKGKHCTPKVSPCCSELCLPIKASKKQVCRKKTECSFESYCDGFHVDCPEPKFRPDGHSCDNGRKQCNSGECSKSLCQMLNLTDCQCISSSELFCHVCCKKDNRKASECVPVSSFINEPYTKHLRREKGHPCNENKGFCDNSHLCIIDSIYNLYSRMDKFFSASYHLDIEKWIGYNWYFLFIGLGILLILVVLFASMYKSYYDAHVESIRVGRLTSALKETQLQKEMYSKKIESYKAEIDKRIQEIKFKKRLETTEAIGRLLTFFPTASLPILIKTAAHSPTEEAAVQILLIRGFSMRKFCISVPGVIPGLTDDNLWTITETE